MSAGLAGADTDTGLQRTQTREVVTAFNDAFNRQDLEAVMALMTKDCVFENTHPPPDGARYVGKRAVRRAFAAFFQSSPHAEFVMEEMFAAGDRCVARWVYRWSTETEEANHVRGVDVFHTRHGLVAAKLSYVKG